MTKPLRHSSARADVAKLDDRPLIPVAVVRSIWLLLSIMVLASQPGCSVYHLAKRTMVCELNEYPQLTDGKLSCRKYQGWAKKEWHRVRGESGEAFSDDYASGFLQGFVDQVYAGGEPIAPPVPPRKYWRVGYRNERGRRAIEDWYHGFEHGAQIAHDGGYRAQAVVPSSLVPGSGQDLRLREGYDGEPVLVPEDPRLETPGSEELQPPSDITQSTESADDLTSANGDGDKAGSALPVSFETVVETVEEEAWSDQPPAPPWHTTPTNSDDPGEPSSTGEFDPFKDSIVSGPVTSDSDDAQGSKNDVTGSGAAPEVKDGLPGQSTNKKPSETESTSVKQDPEGSALPLNGPQNTAKADESTSPFSEPNKPTDAQKKPASESPSTKSNQPENSKEAGWQNKTEPTPWQRRDTKSEQ